MSLVDESPTVSGISPNDGTPGTRITIRGENLGENKQDVTALTINDVNCLESMEYFSSKKLMCTSPDIIGKSVIIVTTLSGGEGFCLVHFIGLQPELQPVLDTLEESDVWIDEAFNPLAPGLSSTIETPLYLPKIKDPLGLSPKQMVKSSVKTLDELFPNSSGNVLAKDFNPQRYLAEKHRFTSFSDLKVGLMRLKSELDRSEEAPVIFMRDNLDIFLQSYDTLSDVNEVLIRNESESNAGSLTDKVEELLREAAGRAEEVFEGVLKCKVRADQTRNALTVLQRYKFLFNLPRSIEKNITNGEYDLVTTDYERAKSLFASTQLKVFKKVMDEVEKQIYKFRLDLRKKLHVLPSSLEEQKRVIKYLLELDYEGDPAWESIINMHQWILKLLFISKINFQHPGDQGSGKLVCLPPSLVIDQDIPPQLPPRSQTVASTGREEKDSRSSHRLSDASNKTTSEALPLVTPSPVRSKDQVSMGGHGSDVGGRPLKILFVEDMTETICKTLPDFWRLGKTYFSGSLFQGVTMLTEHQQMLAKNCGMNQTRFELMALEVIEVYTDMVNCSLFPDAYDKLNQKRKDRLGDWVPFEDSQTESSGDWLPQIVRQIRECVNYLRTLSLPEKAISITMQLAFNVRTLCADTLFHRASRDINVLHEREDWCVQAEEGGIITSLPILFENLVVEVVIALKEIVVEPHSVAMDKMNFELMESSKNHFHALMEHFISCFDYLAFHQEDDLHQESVNSVSQGQNMAGAQEETEGTTPNTDERLLMILSNLSFVMTEIIPRLFQCFTSHGYPPAADIHEAVMDQLHELDDKVFSEYIEHKSGSVIGIIEQGMRVGYFDWDQCLEPTQVRNFVKEVLFNLVLIHAEVHAVSPQIVPRVLCRLVELVSNEFLKLIKEVESFSYSGIMFAYIELATLEEVLEPYLSEQSISYFEASRVFLAEWDVHADDNIHKIVDQFKDKTKLQLRCFRMHSNFDSTLED